MFQSLRPNSQIFVLHKGDALTVESGFVVSVSVPRPKFTQPPIIGKPQETVVDLSVKLGAATMNYSNLDAGADVAESYSNGENIVITTSREAMNAELANLKQRSFDIINSVGQHEKLIKEYDKVLSELNPEFAEREHQKNEMSALKEQVKSMSQSMAALMQSQKELIEKLNRKEV